MDIVGLVIDGFEIVGLVWLSVALIRKSRDVRRLADERTRILKNLYETNARRITEHVRSRIHG